MWNAVAVFSPDIPGLNPTEALVCGRPRLPFAGGSGLPDMSTISLAEPPVVFVLNKF